jgi:hypothetical protein
MQQRAANGGKRRHKPGSRRCDAVLYWTAWLRPFAVAFPTVCLHIREAVDSTGERDCSTRGGDPARTKSVDIVIFRFDRAEIEAALKAAAVRGVAVTALRSQRQGDRVRRPQRPSAERSSARGVSGLRARLLWSWRTFLLEGDDDEEAGTDRPREREIYCPMGGRRWCKEVTFRGRTRFT